MDFELALPTLIGHFLNAQLKAEHGGVVTTFDGANITVPLDYTDSASAPLELNLFRVNTIQEPVLGSVLINFGGPGGTGAENLPIFASAAHDIIGQQWNLISWDPRGTGNTLPFQRNLNVTSLGGTPPKRELDTLVSTNLTEVFLNGGWNVAGQVADICARAAGDNGTLIGTAFVARDMINIVDALGEDGHLRYYGWLYGTALGSYVAAMSPDRIGRMVLDGHVNPHSYQAGSGLYSVFVLGDDEVFDPFLQTCFDAQEDCALYRLLQPETVEELFTPVNDALVLLARNASFSFGAYSTYAAVKGAIIGPLYFPEQWPSLADALVWLINGTPAALPTVYNNMSGGYGPASTVNTIGIRASDATFIANTSDEYLPVVKDQAKVSPGFSDAAYWSIWPSARWRMHARERYWGDFRTTTKTPILHVNGEHDPITPLVNAYNASAAFDGNVVLSHGGSGHGLFASPSRCTAEHVKAYFLNGTLPADGTHCEPDQSTMSVCKGVVKFTKDS